MHLWRFLCLDNLGQRTLIINNNILFVDWYEIEFWIQTIPPCFNLNTISIFFPSLILILTYFSRKKLFDIFNNYHLSYVSSQHGSFLLLEPGKCWQNIDCYSCQVNLYHFQFALMLCICCPLIVRYVNFWENGI